MTENPPQPPGGRTARGGTVTERSAHEQGAADGPWVAVVWNDPVNLMSYVVYVFRAHFGYASPRAEQLMRLVHERGRAIVARGTREQMESDVHALHGHGLRATVEPVPDPAEEP